MGARSYPAAHGGLEIAVEEIACELANRGHHVGVFVSEGGQDARKERIDVRRAVAIQGKYSHTASQILFGLRSIATSSWDVVHVHGVGIDGVSIGTNDLTQLVLGVDRDSEICRDLFDTMDPAVLDAIDVIIERATRAGLTTSLCGQAVSTNPALAEHLVRNGITSVSVAPDVAAITRHNIAAAERRILLDRARSDLRPSADGDRRGGTR